MQNWCHTRMNCQVDFHLDPRFELKQILSIFPLLNRNKIDINCRSQPWPLQRLAFGTLTSREAGSRATLKQRNQSRQKQDHQRTPPKPATSDSATKKLHTRQRSDKLELPLKILMIQLLSRNRAIYISLACTIQDPATCHQKLQELEPAWETIQFP